MKAAILYGVKDLRLENVPDPKISSPDDVLIKVKNVGVCGSDCHYYELGRIGDFIVQSPLILGHECAGEVIQVGSAVQNLKPGDRVCPEPGVPCRKCRFCKSGRYNLCPDVQFMATPPFNGAFCEYIVWPSDFVFKLPENVSYEEGATVEPLSVGVYSAIRGRVKAGDKIGVLGCGPIGLITAQVCLALGADKVFASDLDPIRLQYAEKCGAIAVPAAELTQVILAGTEGLGVDVAFEAAGSVPTTQKALEITRRGGAIVLIGLPPQSPMPYDIVAAICKEVDIMGIFRYANCYPPALSLLASGKLDMKSLITHRFTLEQAEEALVTSLERKGGAIKAMIAI